MASPSLSPLPLRAPRLLITASGLLGAGLLLGAPPAAAAPTEPMQLQNSVLGASDCATCHLFLNPPDRAGEPFIAPQAYIGSLMSNSARDPVFWAGVAIAHQDSPGDTEECVRCHAPIAFLEGRGDAIAFDELEPVDQEGVTCDLCHRMIDDGVTPPGNARYVVDDVDENGTVPRRGPWSYGPGDDPQHPVSDDDAFLASARLCGTCHDVTTPRERVDDDGVGMGVPFNEQRTYSEWLASDYADPNSEVHRTCQDCHMPAIADVAGCDAFNLAQKTHPTGGRRHELVGVNTPVIRLVQEAYGGGSLDDAYFDIALERAEHLATQAASLDVTFPEDVDLLFGIPTLPVTVTNESGHKLPSGYSEGRVMWIEVTARYGQELIYSSGRWDPETREIQADAQVRRYEAIAEDLGDGARFHLLRNNHWVVDSRLPPRGLQQSVETDPVGDRYALGPDDTWPHSDAVDYSFGSTTVYEDPFLTPELTISVRLLYLINTPEYVEFLADENQTNDAGTELVGLFGQVGEPAPIVLAASEQTVPLSGLTPEGPTGHDTTETTTGTTSSTGDPETTAGTSGETGSSDAATGASSTDTAGEDDADGCSCDARGGGARGLIIVVVALAGARRRRPRRRRE